MLEEGNLSLLMDELSAVTADWYDLGVHLGVSTGKLDKIEHGNYDNKLREMIKRWLKKANPQPCWEAIVAALKKDPLGEERLAQSIWERYCKEKGKTLGISPPTGRVSPRIRGLGGSIVH